jgi:flagellar M-ring protein FliF
MANAQEITLNAARAGGLRPLLLLVGIAVAVAAGVAVMLWWQGPNWSLLYGNLGDADASQVTQALQTAGIKYKLNDSTGAIMVPADNVHAARLQLASQGLPGSSNSGIDLISRESGIGVSQFMETARYQYALETELARTVSALKSVEAARVHLAIPQQSAFVRDRRAATASVLVQLRSGARLEAEQVQAIIHLVASSIPELDASAVTVVDQQGHLLSAPESGDGSATAEQLQAAARVEDSYVQRIEQLLQPLLGVGRVRAQVTVDLDPASNEQTREQYAPGSAIVRSEQTSEESSNKAGGTGASGVPGALTNQPPAGGTVAAAATPPATPAAGAAAAAGTAATATATATATAGPESVARAATRNFEIDRTLSYTRQPGGRIKRVTAAVLLDNVRKLGADGKETSQPLPAAQIEDITKLVKSAVGFDETRGDNVSVVNAAFRVESQTLTPEAVPIWQRPMVQDAVRMGLGALILLAIALGILRPLIRNLTAQSPATSVMMSADGSAMLGAPGEAGATGAAGGSAPLAFEQQLVQARTLVAQDPKRVAQVVKNWVGEK